MKITMVCPVCDGGEFSVEVSELKLELVAHETDEVSTEEFQCPVCEKLFYVTG